tara:strand:- start:336 stop:1010 length:675 start_codon:yes stop_codon:yes gene_type:complete
VKDQLPLLLGQALAWTLGFEVLALVARYRLGWTGQALAGRYAALTFGIRLHPAFLGVVLLALAPWIEALAIPLAACGLGLIAGNLLHALILRLKTGDHDLHLCARASSPVDYRAELGQFSVAGALHYGVFWGAIFEGLTIFSRFGLAFESQRDTAALATITGGLRIHHGYIGVLLCLLALALRKVPWRRSLALIAGVALLVSDLVHHFAVLWPITGTHQFFLVY